jgi:hypothetical protein
MMKAKRIRWEGHIARISEIRNQQNILHEEPEETRPLGALRRRWEDNIKVNLKEIGREGVDWIHLAQDRDQ